MSHRPALEDMTMVFSPPLKGAAREGAKGAETPPLATSKFKKDKISDSFDFFLFCFSDLKLCNLAKLWS